jgi:hypothetical protein
MSGGIHCPGLHWRVGWLSLEKCPGLVPYHPFFLNLNTLTGLIGGLAGDDFVQRPGNRDPRRHNTRGVPKCPSLCTSDHAHNGCLHNHKRKKKTPLAST